MGRKADRTSLQNLADELSSMLRREGLTRHDDILSIIEKISISLQ
jgi:hypothetical protein